MCALLLGTIFSCAAVPIRRTAPILPAELLDNSAKEKHNIDTRAVLSVNAGLTVPQLPEDISSKDEPMIDADAVIEISDTLGALLISAAEDTIRSLRADPCAAGETHPGPFKIMQLMRVSASTDNPYYSTYKCNFMTTVDMVSTSRSAPAYHISRLATPTIGAVQIPSRHYASVLSRTPQLTATIEARNESLAGMTLTNLNPLSMLPNCVATKFMTALSEIEGADPTEADQADVSSAPTGLAPAEKHATSVLAAEQAPEREHNRLTSHPRQARTHPRTCAWILGRSWPLERSDWQVVPKPA